MNHTLEELRRRILSAQSLESVVGAMKAMAASNVAVFRGALRTLEAYAEGVEAGLQCCLRAGGGWRMPDAEPRRDLLVVFGSDQGMAGLFNERILDRVEESWGALRAGSCIAVGEKIMEGLEEQGRRIIGQIMVPVTPDGIPEAIRQLLHLFEQDSAQRLWVIRSFPEEGPDPMIVLERLIPPDDDLMDDLASRSWPGPGATELFGEVTEVVRTAMGEYLFVKLAAVCAESIVSENLHRLQAMHRAKQNIDEQLEQLKREYHQLRQTMVDEELFEVLGGFEALREALMKKE